MPVYPQTNPGRSVFARCGQGGVRGFPGAPGLRRQPVFRSPRFYGSFTVSGVTRDSTGTALGSCTVALFASSTNAFIAQTTSDASTGAYSFTVGTGQMMYLVAYKAGVPDVAGTTVNTVTPTPVP